MKTRHIVYLFLVGLIVGVSANCREYRTELTMLMQMTPLFLAFLELLIWSAINLAKED